METYYGESAVFNYKRLRDRNVDELIGLCKGIVADGNVNTEEAVFLQNWLRSVPTHSDEWPFNVLIKRLYTFLEDDILDKDEQDELLSLLRSLTGYDKDFVKDQSPATALLFDTPAPEIDFRFKTFCITGKCVSGSRKQLETLIKDLGGTPQKNVNSQTNYLIIGDIGSTDWAHTSFGRKIETAIEVREKQNDKGSPYYTDEPIAIVSEQHFMESI